MTRAQPSVGTNALNDGHGVASLNSQRLASIRAMPSPARTLATTGEGDGGSEKTSRWASRAPSASSQARVLRKKKAAVESRAVRTMQNTSETTKIAPMAGVSRRRILKRPSSSAGQIR